VNVYKHCQVTEGSHSNECELMFVADVFLPSFCTWASS